MREAPKAAQAVVVAATSTCISRFKQQAMNSTRLSTAIVALCAVLFGNAVQAAVLPEDRIDLLYHNYEGDNLSVDGPSVLVRKSIKDKVSVWANYYVDSVSSASVDVVSTASSYTERRVETSLGADYLYNKTSIGVGFTNSSENDYESNSFRFGISQDFFGDLTTLGIAYARGADTIRRNGDDVFEAEATHQSFRVDLSQILTPSWIVSLNYEAVLDEGFLNNPYRQVRFLDPSAARGFSFESERYPETRTSSATALRSIYYLPYRAALKTEARYYTDTYGVSAYNAEIGYTHPIGERTILDFRYRFYSQTAADFYSDLFERSNQQNFLARDKELSTFTTNTIGVGASWQFNTGSIPLIDKGQISVSGDYIRFAYADFRDLTTGGDFAPGEEPQFQFNAVVLRALISFWF